MLFLPDSIIDARRRLLPEFSEGGIDSEELWHKALKLDPDDHLALVALGRLRAGSGDKAEAEELFWRAIQSQPCAWRAYWELSLLIKDNEPLSKGLAELGCRKLLLTPRDLAEMDGNPSVFKEFRENATSVGHGFEMLADSLRAQRDLEPLVVTARLRSLRLIHQVQVNEFLEVEPIDAIIQEGESIVPLLVGVLRGWAQDVISDEDVFVAANSMALLGEIGDASAIPALLELVTLETPEASGPADWAFDRIVEQHPKDHFASRHGGSDGCPFLLHRDGRDFSSTYGHGPSPPSGRRRAIGERRRAEAGSRG